MHRALTRTDHRPWPLPLNRWTWRQSWNDLLFIHSRIQKNEIAHLVPAPLKVQEFDGSSWIGIVPFKMNGVMRRPFPNLPWFSNFLELNVRLYVEHNGKPGVYFLSLDATNPLVVWGGRRFFNLPYKNANIEFQNLGHWTEFHSKRKEENDDAEFRVQFRTTSDVFFAKQGELEYFLTERYCFYAASMTGLVSTEVQHWPWPLQTAEARVTKNELLNRYGLSPLDPAAIHFSRGVDVVSWPSRRT